MVLEEIIKITGEDFALKMQKNLKELVTNKIHYNSRLQDLGSVPRMFTESESFAEDVKSLKKLRSFRYLSDALIVAAHEASQKTMFAQKTSELKKDLEANETLLTEMKELFLNKYVDVKDRDEKGPLFELFKQEVYDEIAKENLHKSSLKDLNVISKKLEQLTVHKKPKQKLEGEKNLKAKKPKNGFNAKKGDKRKIEKPIKKVDFLANQKNKEIKKDYSKNKKSSDYSSSYSFSKNNWLNSSNKLLTNHSSSFVKLNETFNFHLIDLQIEQFTPEEIEFLNLGNKFASTDNKLKFSNDQLDKHRKIIYHEIKNHTGNTKNNWSMSCEIASKFKEFVENDIQTHVPLYNLSTTEIKGLNILQNKVKNNLIRIRSADKNMGTCVVSYKWYKEQVMNHLNSSCHYKKISNKDFLQKYEFDVTRIPYFYAIPKLHKNPYSIRPIVSYSNVSKDIKEMNLIVNKEFEKIKKDPNCPGYNNCFLKDSDTLAKIINQINEKMDVTNDEYCILSGDIINFYTNIVHQSLIKSCKQFGLSQISISCIEKLLSFSLFIFEGIMYQQTRGIPMGLPCAPALAYIYFWSFEIKYNLSSYTLIYARYIDDILIILKKEQKEKILEFLNSSFIYTQTNLGINLNEGPCSFLDFEISIPCNKIRTESYFKPGNKYQFVNPRSSRDINACITSIISGIEYRMARLNTTYNGYVSNLKFLSQKFKNNFKFKPKFNYSPSNYDLLRYNLINHKENKDKEIFKISVPYNCGFTNLVTYKYVLLSIMQEITNLPLNIQLTYRGTQNLFQKIQNLERSKPVNIGLEDDEELEKEFNVTIEPNQFFYELESHSGENSILESQVNHIKDFSNVSEEIEHNSNIENTIEKTPYLVVNIESPTNNNISQNSDSEIIISDDSSTPSIKPKTSKELIFEVIPQKWLDMIDGVYSVEAITEPIIRGSECDYVEKTNMDELRSICKMKIFHSSERKDTIVSRKIKNLKSTNQIGSRLYKSKLKLYWLLVDIVSTLFNDDVNLSKQSNQTRIDNYFRK